METLAAQPQHQESFRSFDILASINLYRFDLDTFGYVRAETKRRVYDEELSYVTEGINRPLDTTFELPEIEGELAIFHGGRWQPYGTTLLRGWQTAEREAQADPRKTFLAERAAQDFVVGQKLNALRPGESYAWCSPFPDEACEQYGAGFVDSLGFQSKRRMGFIYVAARNQDGSLTLRSKSVDNSDHDAFMAALDTSRKPGAHIDNMVEAYDQTLMHKRGELFYAGRPLKDKVSEENAWTVVERHKDLLEFYFDKLEDLAVQNISPAETERAKKRLTYSLWAALKERLDRNVVFQPDPLGRPIYYEPAMLQKEFEVSYAKLNARGEVLFGCGGAIRGDEALLSAGSENVFDAVFGSKWGEDKYGSLTFKCPNGHINKRPYGKLLSSCQHPGCKAQVACK